MKTLINKTAVYKGVCVRLEWLEGGRYYVSAYRFGSASLPDGFFEEMANPKSRIYTGYINADSSDLIFIEHIMKPAKYKGFCLLIDWKEGNKYHAKNCYGCKLPYGLLLDMEYPGMGEYEGYIHKDDPDLVFLDHPLMHPQN